MTIDLLRHVQAWTEGELSAGATQVMLPQLLAQPVWFPGARQVSGIAGGHPVQRLHLLNGEPGELSTLAVWLEDPALQSPPISAPMLHHTFAALLAFVMNQRFHAVLDQEGERCLVTYDDLLSLRTLMLLRRVADGQRVDTPLAPDVSRLVAPLLAQCAAEPAIRHAWLAVIHSAASTQVAVMIDAPRADWHLAVITRLLDPLLPPGVSLTPIDAHGDFNADVRRAVATLEPLHDVTARHSWFDRMKQRFGHPTVPVIELDLEA